MATSAASAAALKEVRALCLALPHATERISHGSPCFFINAKPSFLMFMDDHHGDGRLAIWCAAAQGAQEVLLGADPGRFFYPPYVGHRGWIGIRLEGKPDSGHIAALIEEAYRAVAPPKYLALLDQKRSVP